MSEPTLLTNQPKFNPGTVYLTMGAQTALERIASGQTQTAVSAGTAHISKVFSSHLPFAA